MTSILDKSGTNSQQTRSLVEEEDLKEEGGTSVQDEEFGGNEQCLPSISSFSRKEPPLQVNEMKSEPSLEGDSEAFQAIVEVAESPAEKVKESVVTP